MRCRHFMSGLHQVLPRWLPDYQERINLTRFHHNKDLSNSSHSFLASPLPLHLPAQTLAPMTSRVVILAIPLTSTPTVRLAPLLTDALCSVMPPASRLPEERKVVERIGGVMPEGAAVCHRHASCYNWTVHMCRPWRRRLEVSLLWHGQAG